MWALTLDALRAVVATAMARLVALVTRTIERTNTCTCGCTRTVHEHYRAGTDCGRCGPSICPDFRRSIWSRS